MMLVVLRNEFNALAILRSDIESTVYETQRSLIPVGNGLPISPGRDTVSRTSRSLDSRNLPPTSRT